MSTTPAELVVGLHQALRKTGQTPICLPEVKKCKQQKVRARRAKTGILRCVPFLPDVVDTTLGYAFALSFFGMLSAWYFSWKAWGISLTVFWTTFVIVALVAEKGIMEELRIVLEGWKKRPLEKYSSITPQLQARVAKLREELGARNIPHQFFIEALEDDYFVFVEVGSWPRRRRLYLGSTVPGFECN